MHNSLYIPEKIIVGFVKRQGTFTGKLAYVIYKDHTGKLRKEASWNSWRDKEIEPVEFDNSPQSGYTFNKGIKRDAYHFGSGRSVIRVYDARDFEFEISVDNLIGVLMHSDVSKRDIVEQCVYAWSGTELVLLPTNSVEYQESTKHTIKQREKVSSKSLVVGRTYSIKRDSTTRVVYLGFFDRYGIENVPDPSEDPKRLRYGINIARRSVKKKKGHIFIDLSTKESFAKDPVAYLAYCESEEMHPEYASFLDAYYHTPESQPVRGLTIVPPNSTYGGGWYRLDETDFVELSFVDYGSSMGVTVSGFARYNHETQSCELSHNGSQGYYTRTVISPHRLPGLNSTREDVKQVVHRADTIFKQILADNKVKLKFDYEQRQKDEMKMCKDCNLGHLRFIMQDGKVSNNPNL